MSRRDATLPTYYSIHRELGSLIQAALKGFLEVKHLYQSVEIGLHPISAYADYTDLVTSIALAPWLPEREFAPSSGRRHNPTSDPLLMRVPTGLKLYCEACDSHEVYNPGVTYAVPTDPQLVVEKPSDVQTFVIAYQCQRCKGTCEIFLVRRDKLKLTLCGRAPMEHVLVPAFIPRDVRKWYRDSLIAYQSGKILAALFYLRTFIEQWARTRTGLTGKADVALDAYMNTLPPFFKDHFYSLRDLYGELSDAAHSAREDGKLYEKAAAEIARHFDGRRLHGVT